MFGLFKSESEQLIGLDISSSAVKLLELRRHGDKYGVVGFGVAPLPTDAVVEHQLRDIDSVTLAIKAVINRAKINTKNVAIALPDSIVMTKVIQMDADMEEDEIESQISIEAEKIIPYPISEVNIDFQVLGPNKKKQSQVDVLLAISRAENVYSRVEAIEKAGLKPMVVDVESYSLERACRVVSHQLPEHGVDQTIAVVDVGSMVTNLIILENFETVFSREEVFGGAQLTREIQRHYGLSFAEAGRAKKMGGLPDDYETEILGPFKESAVLQIRRALQFYFSVTQTAKVNAMLLVGGTPAIPGFAEILEEQLGIPTMIANPFTEMALDDHINREMLDKDAPALMTCCGLALRGFSQ